MIAPASPVAPEHPTSVAGQLLPGVHEESSLARPLGISAHFLHLFAKDGVDGFEAARQRVACWSSEQAFACTAGSGTLLSSPLQSSHS